jgi:hypothetical protein
VPDRFFESGVLHVASLRADVREPDVMPSWMGLWAKSIAVFEHTRVLHRDTAPEAE